MKPVKLAIGVFFIIQNLTAYSQGANCSAPYVLTLDSVTRSYNISATSGNASNCSNPEFSGSGRLTVFSFTTNSSASCVLVYLNTSGGQATEMNLYTGCSGGGSCQGGVSSCSVCFSDGMGYWAPSETYTLAANTTYYLRVWTPGGGTISISAVHYNPPNTLCSGATYISPVTTPDNNSCNKPSTEIIPFDVCAGSLENTAFYTYFVESNGVSSIQINNINCDNSTSGATNGFQIGFFTGSCGALHKLNCASVSGGSVSASTGWQAAGTQVFVGVDGNAGSNCAYTITAFNATVLPVTLKYFTSWKRADANKLTWVTTSEENFSHFEIERSVDGVNFIKIGTKQGKGNSAAENDYSFDDKSFKPVQYYRLKIVNFSGKFTYSNIIKVNRDDVTNEKIIFSNKVTSQLSLKIINLETNQITVSVVDNSGREVKKQIVKINPGENSINLNTGNIPSGFYYLILSGENYKKTLPFLKS